MAYRKKMSKRNSKRYFTKTANKIKAININPKPMRGGIRL